MSKLLNLDTSYNSKPMKIMLCIKYMNKIILSVAVVAIIGGGLFYFLRSKPQVNPTDNKPVVTPAQIQKAKTTEPAQVQKTETVSPTQAEAVEAKDAVINISEFAFSPKITTIKVGEKVTWINQDEAPHVVKSLGFNSESLNKGDKFEFTFTKVGTFEYSCGVHASMNGQIIVK